MKKVLLLFTLFAFFFLGVYAQTPWYITGNSGTDPSTNYIGTTDIKPLIFKTTSTERMRLLEDKPFLGIGTSEPWATLHLHNPKNNGQIPLLQLTTNATGNAATNGFAVFSDYTTKEIRFKQQESAKFFIEGRNGGLVIAPTGKIGIGTTDPQQKVHLDEGNLLITSVNSGNSNAPTGALLFADVLDEFTPAKWGIEYLNSNDPVYGGYGLNFRRYFGKVQGGCGTKCYSILFLSNNGKIGIWNKNPQAELDVAGSFRTQSAAINGNISVNRVTNPNNELEKNAIVFGYEVGEIHSSPLPSKWGIERTYSWPNGDGLNFWKYSFGTVHGGSAGFKSVMYFNDSDNVGIGTENPQAKLDVAGDLNALDAIIYGKLGISTPYTPFTNLQIGDEWTFQDIPNGKVIGRNTYHNGTDDVRISTGVASRISFNDTGEILLQTATKDNSGTTCRWNTVTFANNGDVVVGTTTQSANLVVNGILKADGLDVEGLTLPDDYFFENLKAQNATINNKLTANKIRANEMLSAKEIKVELANPWPDYVFNKDYNLLPLNEVEQFINDNQHLPNVPSAAEVEANGINVGEMNAILLKKMEEMTLYIIALQKQIDELKSSKP